MQGLSSGTPEPRPGLYLRFSRLSLRSKGFAVLLLPVVALLVSLLGIFRLESQARNADLMLVNAYDTRSELLRVQVLLLNGRIESSEAMKSALTASLARLDSLAAADSATAAALGELRIPASQEIRQAALERMAEAQSLRILRALQDRDLAHQWLFRIVILCGILGPLGALFVHIVVAGRLVKRLRVVQENARRLAHGLPLEPLLIGYDEIASVARQLQDAAVLLNGRERELLESERRYRDLFDRAPVPYEETDTQGVIHRFNQATCNLLRCTPDRVLGRRAWDYLPPDQQAAFRAGMLERIAAGTEAGPFECDYLLEDGSRITVEIRESLMRGENGAVTGVCRSLLDITEKNLAAVAARKVAQYAMELRIKNEQLARALDAARTATEAKSRFLASVSHELRTPLNGIIGFSEILYDGRLGAISEEHRDAMGDILASARHLLRLISDILDLSKVEAGKMEFHAETAEIAPLVDEVRDVIRPLAERKQIRLSTAVPDDLEAVLDTGRFKQVLYNYLSNAVKFTPEGGSVSLRVERLDGASFRLEVEDNGIGIPQEEIPLLFQDFQQLPYGRRTDQGTGLGLALTRHIVEAQGGTVAVRSSPGQGSVFSAVLPLSASEDLPGLPPS